MEFLSFVVSGLNVPNFFLASDDCSILECAKQAARSVNEDFGLWLVERFLCREVAHRGPVVGREHEFRVVVFRDKGCVGHGLSPWFVLVGLIALRFLYCSTGACVCQVFVGT